MMSTAMADMDAQSLAAASSAPATANGVLVVDLAGIARNYRLVQRAVGRAETASVVKANAYGLGVAPVARALAAEGCHTFFVATFAEAEALRGILPDARIYALNGLPPGTAADYAACRVHPVLGSIGEIAEWTGFCRRSAASAPAALHIDTGMNRLGLKLDEIRALAASNTLDTFPVSLIMSHFACADVEHGKNTEQCERFQELAAQLPPLPHVPRSLAASAGVLAGRPEFHFDLVRPGIALYGGNPFTGKSNPMEAVVRLYGCIAMVGEAGEGETVGYGAGLTLQRPTRYVTVTTGYADGYFRALGSADGREGAYVYIGEHRLPILGRVSMDLTVFDATDVPETLLARGRFVELLGPRFTADTAAACAGTISYEVLTSLGQRYHRIYIGAKSGD